MPLRASRLRPKLRTSSVKVVPPDISKLGSSLTQQLTGQRLPRIALYRNLGPFVIQDLRLGRLDALSTTSVETICATLIRTAPRASAPWPLPLEAMCSSQAWSL